MDPQQAEGFRVGGDVCFLTLLLLTLLIALLVSFLVARVFERPVRRILGRLVPEDLSKTWLLEVRRTRSGLS